MVGVCNLRNAHGGRNACIELQAECVQPCLNFKQKINVDVFLIQGILGLSNVIGRLAAGWY